VIAVTLGGECGHIPQTRFASSCEQRLGRFAGKEVRMLPESIPFLTVPESTYSDMSRSAWVYFPKNQLRRPVTDPGHRLEQPSEKPGLHPHQCTGVKLEGEGKKAKKETTPEDGPSLFQEAFFFCTVKDIGDIRGAGCIYVETVVDRDSGIAFAKVYSAKNAMNAVDLLAGRVVPYFERQGVAIKEIHTRKTSEYCGLPLAHPFETFLATSDIQHFPIDLPGHPHNHLCEQFYSFLLKEFFLPALRKKFKLSLNELQKDLDNFVGAYNALQMRPQIEMKSLSQPSANFPVDL